MDHLTPMGVAAAYLGELVTEELKTHEASRAAGSRPDEAPSKIVVVAPQEGQVSVLGGAFLYRAPGLPAALLVLADHGL